MSRVAQAAFGRNKYQIDLSQHPRIPPSFVSNVIKTKPDSGHMPNHFINERDVFLKRIQGTLADDDFNSLKHPAGSGQYLQRKPLDVELQQRGTRGDVQAIQSDDRDIHGFLEIGIIGITRREERCACRLVRD